jgi:transposase
MLKLELKCDPNSLKFLDNLFNEYEQLVKIADSFIYHLYPYYANINEQEKLERLKELIKSLDEKAIRKNKRRKREPYEEEEQTITETEDKHQYTHSKLLKTLLHHFIKYAKKYYGIDAKYAYLEMQGGLADLMHSNAESAYKHRSIPNLRGLSNVMPIRVSKRPLLENRRSKDNNKYYQKDAEFIFSNGKIMFRIGRGKHKVVFNIATRFNDDERLSILIKAIQGNDGLTIGDPCYLVRKDTHNGHRYYIMVSISKNVDTKALHEKISNKNKIRIIGIDSNISKYIATIFCIEVDKENKEFKLINAKGIDSKNYINAIKEYEEERRKLQQGRMKGKISKKKGSRYKEKEDYTIKNRCGDSKREDLRRQLIGYICNQILEFANENDADIIVIEDLKGLNKELNTLKIIKKELGRLYNDVNDKGNNAIDDKINEVSKKYKNKIRRPLLEILNKIKEYSNNRDRIKVAKYILKQRQIIEKRIFLLSIMAYYQFKQELEVEALWNGKLLYTINPKYTSQQCLRCNHTNKLNRITQRQFKCIKCNFEMNADFNASANIALRFASEILKLELNLKQGESSSMMTVTITNATTPLHASINAGSKASEQGYCYCNDSGNGNLVRNGSVAPTMSSVASILQGCYEGRSLFTRGQTEQPCSAKRFAALDEFIEKRGNGG